MRVLLINPPRSPTNAIYEWAPDETKHLVHRKLIGPPLGLLTIAAAAQSDHDIELLEMKGEYDFEGEQPPPVQLLRQWLERCRPDVAGLTFIASEYPVGMELLREVKRFDPEIVTVAGGLHAQLCPEHFDDPVVDVVSTAQAPQVFSALLDALEQGKPLDGVGGILYRDGERLRRASAPLPEWDVAGKDFVFPDRSLIEPWLQTYRVGRAKGLATYLYTSLGCPHRCSFCSIWPQFRGRYHQREVESVIEELKTLGDYDAVRFSDANTVVDLDFIDKLFDRISEEGLQSTFIMDIRIDTAANNPKLIEKLARGGLKIVIAGIESFRDEELRTFNKSLRADLISKAVEVFHDNGIMVRGNYVIPPSYGESDFDALAEYAEKNKVALAGYTILTPMPGTALYRELYDQIIDHDLANYNFFNCVLETKLPLERFYSRMGELWHIRLGSEVI